METLLACPVKRNTSGVDFATAILAKIVVGVL